jgi:hypothetical protein
MAQSKSDLNTQRLAVAGFVGWRVPSKQKMQPRQGKTALLI